MNGNTANNLISPLRLFFSLLIVIFVMELLVMLVLPLLLPNAGEVFESFADSFLLTALSAPFLWLLIVRPLRNAALTEMGRTEAVMDHVVDGVVILGDGGIIESFNAAAEGMFAYEAAEVTGKEIGFLLPDAEGGAGVSSGEAVPAGDEAVSTEIVGRRRNGLLFPLEISVSKVRVGDARKSICIMRDITARKRAEEAMAEQARELARSNAELEQFASAASHDLQEPLRMIGIYLQLLQRRYAGRLDPDADEYIGFAVEGATRMQMLIKDLLTLSLVGAGEGKMTVLKADAALEHALDVLKGAIEENGAVITHDPLPTVVADEAQLARLFENLIGNAIKFRREEPPRVHVRAEIRERDWLFSVRDNGIGIAPDYAEAVFLLFKRLHSRELYPGTGIGLAECRKIVERHGGTIWVESEPGKGSTFRFTIPEKGGGKP